MLLKVILITLLLVYISVRIGGFIFRTMYWMLGARSGQRTNPYRQQPGQRASRNQHKGDINIDYIPEDELKKRRSGFNGGEYVDYEEVK